MPTHKQTLLLHALKYATYTLVAITVVFGIVAFLRYPDQEALQGRVLNAQERGEVPRVVFDADRAIAGYTAPASTHVIFTVPDDVRIAAVTFLGGKETHENVRYWYYCFSGNEGRNKEEGKTGNDLYDGKFGYSEAERRAQQLPPPPMDNLLDILRADEVQRPSAPASQITVFTGGESCYLMSEAPLPVGIDEDGDLLNSALERKHGTDPKNPDTDGDGIPDGIEVFVTKTNPAMWDTDGDGLSDGMEDKNQNGIVDPGETSPLLADTDRDGLCDGDGTGWGCPEPRSWPFRGEDLNQNGIVDPGETDPTKRDTTGDGLTDLEMRWNEFYGTPGVTP